MSRDSNVFTVSIQDSIPSYVVNAVAGQWVKIGLNTPQSVKFNWGTTVNGVVYPNPSNASDFMDLFGVWTGAAYDPARKVMYFNGGGHSNYNGNEYYAFHLNTNLFERVNNPSPYDEPAVEDGDILPDGTVKAIHTYGSNECDGNGVIHILSNGSASIATIYKYNPGFGTWPIPWTGLTVPPAPTGPTAWGNTGQGIGSGFTGTFIWDSVNATFYGAHVASGFVKPRFYTPSTNTSGVLPSYNATPAYQGGLATGQNIQVTFDTLRRLLYIIGGSGVFVSRGTVTFNVDTNVWNNITSQTTGDKTMETHGAAGATYDSRRDLVWMWDGVPTVRDLFTFDYTTKVWTKISPSGPSPLPAFYQGTYNKFRYIEDYDVFVVCCGNTDSDTAEMWMYKPADWLS